jgi:hypothetical protein
MCRQSRDCTTRTGMRNSTVRGRESCRHFETPGISDDLCTAIYHHDQSGVSRRRCPAVTAVSALFHPEAHQRACSNAWHSTSQAVLRAKPLLPVACSGSNVTTELDFQIKFLFLLDVLSLQLINCTKRQPQDSHVQELIEFPRQRT